MSTTKHFVLPTIPIISGEYRNDATGARQPLGVGMSWWPGGTLPNQLQQERLVIRLHYPAAPATTSFQVQISEVPKFDNPARTSNPAAVAVAFAVTDGVAQYSVTGYTPQNTTVYPGPVVFANYPGKQFYARVRFTGGPWSVGAGFHPYYDSADDVYVASGLPNPLPA